MAEEPMFKKPKLEDEEDENTTGISCTASIFLSDFVEEKNNYFCIVWLIYED